MLRARVGLEVHVQVACRRKLFSDAPVPRLNSVPNSHLHPFDAALPGTLPVLSRECVVAGIRAATALSCSIAERSEFDRKHYFYFDLPSGYQITQHRRPLATSGFLNFHVHTKNLFPYQKLVAVERIQLEQDSGKSVHDVLDDRTLIDLNRAGTALLEIVTEPTLRNGLEATCFVDELLTVLKLTKVTHARAEHGEYRVDANVSIDDSETGYRYPRVEVKNLTGLTFIQNAIEYETERQLRLLSAGGTVERETRHFDPKAGARGETYRLRQKEDLFDYRYMPEPNLPPLRISSQSGKNQAVDVLAVDDVTEDLADFKTPFQLAQRWIDLGADANHAVVVALSDAFRDYTSAVVAADEMAVPHSVSFVWVHLRQWMKSRRIRKDKLKISAALCTRLASNFKNRVMTEPALIRVFDLVNSMSPKDQESFEVPTDMRRITDKAVIKKLLDEALKDPVMAAEVNRAHPTKSKRKMWFYTELIRNRLMPLAGGNVVFEDWDEVLRPIYTD